MMRAIQGPTLTNPFALTTVEELQRALDETNHLALEQFMAATTLTLTFEEMACAFDAILIAHMRDDTDGVSRLLAAYLAPRERLRERLETQVPDGAPH